MLVPTIVCGVDGSPSASGAIVLARVLREWLEWRLVVVHVADMPVFPGASAVPGATGELRELALAEGDALLDDICDTHDLAGDVERRVEVGDRAEWLVRVCEEEDADLLVLGSRSRGRIASALLGSVSMRILSRAPCPVAIVPESASLSREALELSRRRPSPVATAAFPVQRPGWAG